MIYLILALIFFGLWYVTDKTLKENFFPYIKWSALAIIVFFVIFDVNMMFETNRFIEVRRADATGLDFSQYNNATNTTVVTTMYGIQTNDSAAIMAYHYSEFAVWPVLMALLPYLFILVGGGIVMQLVSMWYDQHKEGKLK